MVAIAVAVNGHDHINDHVNGAVVGGCGAARRTRPTCPRTVGGGDHASAYELALSTDDATYTVVARGLGSELTQIGFPTQVARYVRIRQIGSGYDHWWSIHEITVVP